EAAATLTLVCALLAALPFARMMRLLGLHMPDGQPSSAGTCDPGTARAIARAVAHAWNRCGGVTVSGGTESLNYAPIAVFQA
ncbi:hypothetical protein, partial [Azospirillum sp.]|uniref:hypothetical protein n=1 Tax=Azospirillum sp. TaxID=34012 RepID=UPI002D22BB62